jgi:hypothetical protein
MGFSEDMKQILYCLDKDAWDYKLNLEGFA